MRPPGEALLGEVAGEVAGEAAGQRSGSHILAWADRPEARREAALYGTPDQVAAKIQTLRAAGVTTVLANILGQARSSPRRLAALSTAADPVSI